MAKLTKKRVLDTIEVTCDIQEWDVWNDAKGDKERTKINHLIALCSIKDSLNTLSVFDTHYPDGIAEVVEGYKEKYEQFRQQFIRSYPDDFIAFSLTLDLSPIGATKYNSKKDPALEVEKFCAKQKEVEEEPKQVDSEYKGLTLRELRKLCRERDITVPSGAKEEDLIALLEEQDESGEQPSDDSEESEAEDTEVEEETKPAPKKHPAKKVEEPEDGEEELEEADEEPTPKKSRKEIKEPDDATEVEEEQPAEEPEDEDIDEASAYDEMELEELCEECDRRGIEYKKGAKAHVLIELLTQDDKNSAESNEDEEIQKEVDELDELLDENFVDEEIEAVAQEESNAKVAKAKKNRK